METVTKIHLFVLFSFLSLSQVISQTKTWDGSLNSDWNRNLNWTPPGVPDENDNVIIPNVAGAPDPQIVLAQVKAKSVKVESGAKLTIQSSGKLTIPSSTYGSYGIQCRGAVQNFGTIDIRNVGIGVNCVSSNSSFTNNGGLIKIRDANSRGIQNNGTFINQNGGNIEIDQTGDDGVFSTGTFSNSSQLNIGQNSGQIIGRGIENQGIFNNLSGGSINIDKTTDLGLFNTANATFKNHAAINIGQNAGQIGNRGISNQSSSTFENFYGGNIKVDHTDDIGITNFTNSNFKNYGAIYIGQNGGQISNTGLANSGGTFENLNGGSIIIGNTAGDGLANLTNGTFKNAGLINIGQNGGQIGEEGLLNTNSTFENLSGSIINVDRTNNNGILSNFSSTFKNNATINIGQNGGQIGKHGIWNSNSNFDNLAGAIINIDKTNDSGLYNQGTGMFKNAAAIHIGQNGGQIGGRGIENVSTFNNTGAGSIKISNTSAAGIYNHDPSATFTNTATIELGPNGGNNSIGTTGLYNSDGATFNNNGGMLGIDRTGSNALHNLSTGIFNNAAVINIGQNGGQIGVRGIENEGSMFENLSTGIIYINNTLQDGILNKSNALFRNAGTFHIGPNCTFFIQNNAEFINTPCGAIYTSGTELRNLWHFTNKGLLSINTSGSHSNFSTFTNEGVLHYVLNKRVPNVTNKEIIVAPTTVECGSAVSPAFALGSPVDFNILGVFTDAAGNNSAGSYDQATNTFTPNSPVSGTNDYYVKIADPAGGCTRIVSWKLTVDDGTPPTFTCPADITVDANAGTCEGTVPDLTALVNDENDNCGNVTLGQNEVAGSTFGSAPGDQLQVTVTADDGNGNQNTMPCVVTLTLRDGEAPQPVCQNFTAQLDASGSYTVSSGNVLSGGIDNCGTLNFVGLFPGTVGCGDIGSPVEVTVTVNDGNGNTNTCSSLVTVEDNIAPTAVCPASIPDVVLDASGNGTLPANIGDGSSTDNCSAAETSPVLNFTCADLGQQVVTLEVSDGTNSVTTNCAFNVVDNTDPVAICPASIPDVVLDANGNGTLPANIGDGSSTDNCSAVESSPALNFNCADLGTQTVTLTVTDGTNMVNTDCSFNVVDNISPTAMCPASISDVLLDANGNGSLPANIGDGSSTDNCLAIETSPQVNFSCTDLGQQTVTLTVTDGHNTTSTACSFKVVDNIVPTVACQPVTYTLPAGGTVTVEPDDLFANGSDNCGAVTIGPAFPAQLTCADLGANSITLTVNDGSGNPATCQATVTVLAGPYFTWYKDTDNDGYSSGDLIEGCTAPGNYKLAANLSATSGDCNDHDPFVHPDRFETCNGADDDCDGTVDENAVTGISVANISSCDGNGTPDPSDDTFTADVTVIFDDIAPVGNLVLTGDASASVPVGEVSGGSHTFNGVEMSADGGAISLSAGFAAATCLFSESNAGTAPSGCSVCEVMSISVANPGGCNPNGNVDPSDDTFTADVTVTFYSAPATGTLDLSGDGTASVAVAGLTGGQYVFTGVEFTADGGPIALTAAFSDGPACALSLANAGTAMAPCCFVEITEIQTMAETCTGSADGSLEVQAIGTGILRYSLDGGASWQLSNLFENLGPGNYDVTVQEQGQACATLASSEVGIGSSAVLWWKDHDGDGYTDGTSQTACPQPTGYVASALPGDCNDYDADEYPGQEWFEDLDGDGYGTGASIIGCSRPVGHSLSTEMNATSGDCNDNDPSVHPGATEICNGIDDDCDGGVDENTSGGLTYVGNVNFTNQSQVDDFSQCYFIIDGNLTIQNTNVVDLSNLIQLTEVTGYVYIKSTGLTNMNGLDNLTTIGDYLNIQYNNSLNSLNGLNAVTSVGGYLRVYRNNILTDCCAIHDLIENGGVAGSIFISRNDTGCDNVSQINIACSGNNLLISDGGAGVQVTSGAGVEDSKAMGLYPNPSEEEVNIQILGQFTEGTVRIYDQVGRIVYSDKLLEDTLGYSIKVGKWETGVYLVRLELDNEILTQKLMVK